LINSLLDLVGGNADKAGFGLSSCDYLADLEAPIPHSRLDLHKREFSAPAIHDGHRGRSFASSSASNRKSTSRSASV
jgi:hypothetical protein